MLSTMSLSLVFVVLSAGCAGYRVHVIDPGRDWSDGASFDASQSASQNDAADRDAAITDTGISRPAPVMGSLRFRVLDQRTRQPIAAHLSVRGVDRTADPDLGPRHRADGALQSRIASSGEGTIALPVGGYRVVVDRGPEWSIFDGRVDVVTGDPVELTVSIEHVLPMSDWTACDLHVHAERSFDSRVSIEDRVASLVAVGIEFATPTEHNVVGDYSDGVAALPLAARGTRGAQGPGLVWVPAVEVTTDRAGYPIGHFNAFPYQPTPTAPHGGPPDFLAPATEIFRQIRANNPTAIIQVNHPRMETNIGYFTRTELDPVTNRSPSARYDANYNAIEVFNGYYLGVPAQVDRVLHDWLALLSTGAHYVGTANSDSHQIAYEAAGYPRTYVWTPRAGDSSPAADQVLRSLRGAHAFGTSGPMLYFSIQNTLLGDTVRAQRGQTNVHATVVVQAAPWVDVDIVEVYRDRELVATVAVPTSNNLNRLEVDLDLPITQNTHSFVAVARGDRPMNEVLPRIQAMPFAFTNPIWVQRRR